MKKAAQKDGSGTTLPPALPQVKIYFMQKGLSEQEAVYFFRFLQARSWKTKTGIPIANWKAFANEWISSFGHKLIILDLWGVHCSTCIHMFPLEDSLQHRFKDLVQFVLVTMDSAQKVKEFLNQWNRKHNKALSLPMATSGTLYYKLFRLKYIPHYVWLMPNGTLLAQTSEDFVNEGTIRETLKAITAKERELKDDGFKEDMFRFPSLTDKQKLQFKTLLKPNALP